MGMTITIMMDIEMMAIIMTIMMIMMIMMMMITIEEKARGEIACGRIPATRSCTMLTTMGTSSS